MTVALIITDLGPQPAQVQILLMKTFSETLANIKKSINDKRPVIHRELFNRQDKHFGSRLLRTLEQLDELGCKWKLVELVRGEKYSPDFVYYEVTKERLRNVLTSHERELKRQQVLGWLEDGAPEN